MNKVANRKRWKYNEVLAILVVIWFATAWFIGKQISPDNIEPFVEIAFPDNSIYQLVGNGLAEVTKDTETIGYIAIGEASGYGGPLQVIMALDTIGNTSSMAILSHRETPVFFEKTTRSDILKDLVRSNIGDAIVYSEDIDAVSGATFTSRAIVQSVQNALNQSGKDIFNLDIVGEKEHIQFGFPEILLILLFLSAFVQRKLFKGKTRKIIRWFTLITGMIFIGFVFNQPFVLSHINMVLLGYFPAINTHIYWYILIAGLLIFKTEKNWNTYCYDFCPFGACQEVAGLIGGAKPKKIPWSEALKWMQRVLVIFAVSLALIYRNPGFPSFEIFSTLFSLDGSNIQFVVLAIVLLSSLFVYRPFCNYLCPLHKNTMEGLFDRTRKNLNKLWKNLISQKVQI